MELVHEIRTSEGFAQLRRELDIDTFGGAAEMTQLVFDNAPERVTTSQDATEEPGRPTHKVVKG